MWPATPMPLTHHSKRYFPRSQSNQRQETWGADSTRWGILCACVVPKNQDQMREGTFVYDIGIDGSTDRINGFKGFPNINSSGTFPCTSDNGNTSTLTIASTSSYLHAEQTTEPGRLWSYRCIAERRSPKSRQFRTQWHEITRQ